MNWKGNEILKQSLVEISSLRLDEKNVRHHDDFNLKVIGNSLDRLGQQTPIVHKEGVVMKGNGTLQAALNLGWTHIAAIETDLSGKPLKDYKLTDNKSSDLSYFERDALGSEFEERIASGETINDFEAIGFDEKEVKFYMQNESQDEEPPKERAPRDFDHECPKCQHQFNCDLGD